MILLRFYALALGVVASLAAAAHLRRDRETLVRLATLWFAVLVGAAALALFRRRYDRGRDAQGDITT